MGHFFDDAQRASWKATIEVPTTGIGGPLIVAVTDLPVLINAPLVGWLWQNLTIREQEKIGILTDVTTLDAYRRDGVAANMIRYAEKLILLHGFTIAELAQDDGAENMDLLRHLYEDKLGYERIDSEPIYEAGWSGDIPSGFPSGLYSNAYRLRKVLSSMS